MTEKNTIAAIATSMSSSGIGIVRISGGEAFSIIDRIFRTKGKKEKKLSKQRSHTVHYGYICDGDEMIDEVLVVIMKGPHSYTAEDTVEIDCHGGVLVMKKILETVVKHGARPAEPGEFTKRAFLNGRIDLSQAEAVIELINAKNQYAMKSSVEQMKGAVSGKIRDLREKIIYQLAYIESALDDPEHISLDGYGRELDPVLAGIEKEITKLLDTADDGRIMTEGIKTVILGKPNAGKSSLMNVLVGEERAIVTEVEGTTRDVLEEHIYMQGISLNIIDTAGIRSTEDVVEKIGVEKARAIADQADLILYVADASRPLDENDFEIIRFIQDKKTIVILNKTDLKQRVTAGDLEKQIAHEVIPVSVKEKAGIESLEQKIKQMFYRGEINFNDEIYITNMRHKNALEEAFKSIEMVQKSIRDGMPEDFYSIDLMNAYEQLGTIIGEAVEDDLVKEIFSRFCMGK